MRECSALGSALSPTPLGVVGVALALTATVGAT
jgi:hypothetical protein